MTPASPLYLSRATLRRNVPAAALRDLLLPPDDGQRMGAGHRLIWALFADSPERQRDFLWREADAGVYYLLSQRPPEDRHGMFELDPPKPFAPALATGDRLDFVLRVNATVARKQESSQERGKRSDIVMNALYDVVQDQRAEMRAELLAPVAHEWLTKQGVTHGFTVGEVVSDEPDTCVDDWGEVSPPVRVLGYRVLQVDRGRKAPAMRIGVLDVEGTLRVRNPAAFVSAIGHGFGRAKAFGCGLMLVRRA